MSNLRPTTSYSSRPYTSGGLDYDDRDPQYTYSQDYSPDDDDNEDSDDDDVFAFLPPSTADAQHQQQQQQQQQQASQLPSPALKHPVQQQQQQQQQQPSHTHLPTHPPQQPQQPSPSSLTFSQPAEIPFPAPTFDPYSPRYYLPDPGPSFSALPSPSYPNTDSNPTTNRNSYYAKLPLSGTVDSPPSTVSQADSLDPDAYRMRFVSTAPHDVAAASSSAKEVRVALPEKDDDDTMNAVDLDALPGSHLKMRMKRVTSGMSDASSRIDDPDLDLEDSRSIK